jgi:hypothetical protein
LQDWEEIFITLDETEAGMMRDMLESGGIEVVVRSAKITPYPVSIGKMGEIRLLVKSGDAGRARQLIESFNRTD